MDVPQSPAIIKKAELHPADVADGLQRLPPEAAAAALAAMPLDRAAAVFAELDHDHAQGLLRHLSPEQIGNLLKHLPHDEAADLAQDLPEEQRGEALASMPAEAGAKVRALLQYGKDTAGGIMTDRFVTLRADQTIQQAQEVLRGREEKDLGEISYLYVTDPAGKMVGIVPLRDLVFRRPDRLISEVMKKDVHFLRVDADKEEIAREFEHYHFMGLPVLDREGKLAGVVRATDALEVARAEATEDMQLMVGLSGEERALTPWHRAARFRLPWLLVNLATAFVAGAVVGLFESTIARWTVLAVFLPIVAGQGGNAGVQTLTVIIRDLALGEIAMRDAWPVLRKESLLGLTNGLAIGVVVAVGAYLWMGDPRLGLIVGVAMVLNMLAAAVFGVLIPYGLKTFKVDPALASSIFLTTVTDVAGFFFFLGLATLAMKWWGL